MAATLTIVNQHGQTLAAHRLGNTPLAIRAQDQVQYQLAGEGGMAPANVEAARAGNDLLVNIDGQQALRIEDYFLLDDSGLKNPLLGMNGNGQYVAYGIVEAPSVLPVEHVLAEEVAGVGVAAGEGASVSALTAFGIGTLALGGLALAASNGNENSATNPGKGQPQTPFDPNQPAPPPADNGNTTPPPSGGGNTNPPPSGGGNTTPPPSGGGNTNPPPSGGGNTNPPPPPQLPTPNGSIAIEGDAKVGQTLTAKISDTDGVSGSPQYQWLADGQPIQGATQSTYTLTANEKGKTISVQATYTDGENTLEKPSSAATAPVIEDTPAPPPPAADITAPTLAISATPSTLTPSSSAQLTFKASEAIKGFTADDVIVQGGTLSNFRQVDATTFTATFTAGAAGKASVTVADDAFVDLANNPNELANLELVIGAAPTPQNQTPTDITLSADRLPENQAGTVIGKLATVDPDAGDSHTYAVNDNRFEVDAQGNLKLKDGVKVEFAQEKTISLEITTTDKAGDKYSETFTINVQDDPNYPAPNPPTPPNGGKLGVYVPKPATDFVANVKDAAYGAKGDGKTDDTAAIQKAIDAVAAKGGGIVDIPAGTYLINAASHPAADAAHVTRGLEMRSNVIVRMTDDTVLKAMPNDKPWHNIFHLWEVDNVAIFGGTLIGERYEHRGTDGEWGHGIQVRSARHVVIENVRLKEFWGDGMSINHSRQGAVQSEDIILYQVHADGNRRQGLSIGNGRDIQIIESQFSNTGHSDRGAGTPPMAGIDIEPESHNSVHNVTIRDSRFENNRGAAVEVNGSSADSQIENLVVHNNILHHNQIGIVLQGTSGHTISHNTITANTEHGKSWRPYSHSIHLTESTHDNVVTGNTIHKGGLRDLGSNYIAHDNRYTSKTWIRGIPRVGAVLEAGVNNDDADPRDISYQWYADNKPIDGATGQTYTLTAAERGKIITARATFTNGQGERETAVQSFPDFVVTDRALANHAPSDLELLNNRVAENRAGAVVGQIRVQDADTYQLKNPDGSIREKQADYHHFSVSDVRFEVENGYLKLKDGQTLSRADAAEIGLDISVRDSAGATYSERVSVFVGDPSAPNDGTPNGRIGIGGKAQVGATLAAQIIDPDGIPLNPQFRWLADGQPIDGATQGRYTVRPEDLGKTISVQASYTDKANVAENPISTATDPVIADPTDLPNPPENDDKLGVHVPKPITDFIANAKEFGAKGNGQSDDTAAIQKAINAVAEKGGGIVDIPAGTYMVDAERGIDLKSNVIVRMGDDTVLKVKPNAAASYEIFHIHNVENAHIFGGTLEGDRSAHTGTGGEWGMGIRVTAASNVVIEGVTVREMWGDGIYLGKADNYANQNENIVIYGVNMDHNRRQGISVTQGQGVKIFNSVFQNTDGTDPRAGIDLEPNANESVRDVEIRGNQFLDNHIGFLVANHRQPGAFVENVVFENNVLKGNPRDAIILRGLEGGSIKGNTIHIDPDAHHHDSRGIRLYNGDLRPTRDVEISNNTLYGSTIMPRDTSGNTIADNQFKAAVFIRGEAEVGKTLTAAVYDGDIPPQDGIRYRWFVGDNEIRGADGQTYTVRPQDAGKAIRVQVDFTDGAGQSESAQSAHTPTVPGTYTPPADGKLGVHVPKPTTDFIANVKDAAYGATGAEYQIRPADNGKILSVRATFTDAARNTEHAESLPGIAVGGEQPNRRPTDIRVDGNELMENRPGAIIGKVQVIDPDKEDSYTYKFFDPRFEVKDGYLKLKDGKSVSLANEKSIEIVFAAFDKGGVSHLEYHTVKILDDPDYEGEANRAPTDITLSNTSVMENRPGAIVGKIDTLDPDLGDGHRYNLSVGKFTVQDGYLKLHPSQSLDYSADRITILNITSTDDLGAKISKTFRIDVQDDPDYPAPAALAEQTAPATAGAEKSTAVAKPLTLRFEPELNFDNLERGSDAQDRFTLDGQGVKTIVDFNISDGDLLQLESDAFTALDKGTLAESAFSVGDKAGNAEHRVIYNASTGELAYDPDGSGAAASNIIARLDPALELEAQHIQII